MESDGYKRGWISWKVEKAVIFNWTRNGLKGSKVELDMNIYKCCDIGQTLVSTTMNCQNESLQVLAIQLILTWVKKSLYVPVEQMELE